MKSGGGVNIFVKMNETNRHDKVARCSWLAPLSGAPYSRVAVTLGRAFVSCLCALWSQDGTKVTGCIAAIQSNLQHQNCQIKMTCRGLLFSNDQWPNRLSLLEALARVDSWYCFLLFLCLFVLVDVDDLYGHVSPHRFTYLTYPEKPPPKRYLQGASIHTPGHRTMSCHPSPLNRIHQNPRPQDWHKPRIHS